MILSMKKQFVILLAMFFITQSFGQTAVHVYLFPGQGSDYRIFSEFKFPDDYTVHEMVYPIPSKDQTLQNYAYSFMNQIDTSGQVILIGVSLGGMICTELADTVPFKKVIVISSAKSRNELPARYRFQSSIPINEAIPEDWVKEGAMLLQPIVEPVRNTNEEIFKAMLGSKDPLYLKRTADMIINWNRETYHADIIHIHGDNDHTLPHRNVAYDYLIKNGSHMMALTRGKEINTLVQEIIGN